MSFYNFFKLKSRIFVKQYAKVLVFGQIYEHYYKLSAIPKQNNLQASTIYGHNNLYHCKVP